MSSSATTQQSHQGWQHLLLPNFEAGHNPASCVLLSASCYACNQTIQLECNGLHVDTATQITVMLPACNQNLDHDSLH